MSIRVLVFAVIFWTIPENDCSVNFTYSLTESGIQFEVINNNVQVLTGVLNNGVDVTGVICNGIESCNFGEYTLTVNNSEDTLHILWETKNLKNNFTDCFEFGTAHWYGGPQARTQHWPLELVQINGSEPYILNSHFASEERYWLNSNGVYIFLDERVPLYVDQNVNAEKKVCFDAHLGSVYVNRIRNFLEYIIVVKDDAKQAHLHAVNNYLGKPTGYPNEAMIKEAIWITWGEHKSDISDEVILSVAQDIRDHGYTNGQFLIDGNWESCYGSQEFNLSRFGKIVDTVNQLHAMNFRVTLWTHPFVNTDCEDTVNEGLERDYFVKNINGRMVGQWWHGPKAYTIDFTKPEAVDWYTSKINKVQKDTGIDSFKFDGGETFYAPQPTIYGNVDPETIPGVFTDRYLRASAKYGDLIEVRVAHRSQYLPIFMRMLDKNTVWGTGAGLYTLIASLLQLNLSGYTLVLPDIIGGNGYYNETPEPELLVRWTQANTFMPAMQFSFPPWHFEHKDYDTAAIVKSFADLHANFTPAIIEAMKNNVKYGTPVNPPIWWIDPTDEIALASDDEFLLGENILVAPVVYRGLRSRDIYLPKGKWIDGNNGSVYEGPVMLKNYSVPIELLPYFINLTN